MAATGNGSRLRDLPDFELVLERAIETAPMAMVVYDLQGHPVYSNPGIAKMMGVGPPPEYCLLEDPALERQGLLEPLRRAFAGEDVTIPPIWYDALQNVDVDTTGVTRGRMGMKIDAFPIFDRSGDIRYAAIWGVDVTAELELHVREERQRLTFAAARAVALDSNLTQGTIQVSDNAHEVLGLEATTPLATVDDLLAMIHPAERAGFAAAERAPDDDAVGLGVPFRLGREGGAARWFERRSRVRRDDLTGDLWRRGILFDVTERVVREAALRTKETALRRAEDQLRHAHKLEAIGRLAGGIAHDFNNLLSVILGYGQRLRSDPEPSLRWREGIEAICQAGEQAASLTRQLLAVSRQQVITPQVLDLGATVRATVDLLRRVIGETINLVVETQAEPTPILADPGQIDQVVLNLAVNARDAMPGGGTVTIETRAVILSDLELCERLGLLPGPHVLLAVRDDGVGMDEESQRHIFEPFFTTKPRGQGTGLGLATVFGIVQQSRGCITVESSPGRGATFSIYFPRSSEVLGHVDQPPPAHDLPDLRGSETVLLVEDRDDVRRVVSVILESYGYRVLPTPGAREALGLCERHQGTIDLMLTDIVMPEMNGRELAEAAAPLRPDMRVLFMSGYTEDEILRRGVMEAGFAFLQKPLVPETLAQRLRDLLARPRR